MLAMNVVVGSTRASLTLKKTRAHLLRSRRAVGVRRKPSSVSRSSRLSRDGDHSSRTIIAGRLKQPTHKLGRVTLFTFMNACLCGLAPGGACLATRVTTRAVGSYPAISPFPIFPFLGRSEVCFLLRCPRRFRHRALPGTALFGARTFLLLQSNRRSPAGHRRDGRDQSFRSDASEGL